MTNKTPPPLRTYTRSVVVGLDIKAVEWLAQLLAKKPG